MQAVTNIVNKLITWVREESGQTLVEYALIIALVSIALVLALQALAGGIDGVFSDIVAEF